jgi:hypothetical protein
MNAAGNEIRPAPFSILALGVLELLPVEPGGISLHELAEELLGRRDPRARGRVRRAVGEIETALGPLHECRVDVEDLGLYRVRAWGLHRNQRRMPECQMPNAE